MAIKKHYFAEDEMPICDEVCLYKESEYWLFHVWLPKQNKYARKSLHSRSEETTIEKVKVAYLEIYAKLQQGKFYFSKTTKEGLTKSSSFRTRNVEFKNIAKRGHPTRVMQPMDF